MTKPTLFRIKLLVISLLILCGCRDDGKVIEAKGSDYSKTGIFSDNQYVESSNSDSLRSDSYKVKALEVLQTSKYSYLKVEGEGDDLRVGEPYWIATLKNDFNVGEEYLYTGRLLKKDFESKEFNRMFDKIYLVSFIEKANGLILSKSTIEDIVTIAELVASPLSFTGKKVRVRGQVVKVNDAIMERNWIHLVDGSADDYDFVITSNVSVPLGHAMAFEGVITTNKDFGAGYKYELLMEDAVTIK
jgi:hypothetical protein